MIDLGNDTPVFQQETPTSSPAIARAVKEQT